VAGKRLSTAPRSNWSQAARRFQRQRLAMAGPHGRPLLVLVALFAPLIAPTHYENPT
jgi:ABC-type antimicrobial peptide transport system permease subunit